MFARATSSRSCGFFNVRNPVTHGISGFLVSSEGLDTESTAPESKEKGGGGGGEG